MGFDEFNLSTRLWIGVASLYAFCFILALMGVIAIAEGEVVEGMQVIGFTALGAWPMHNVVKRYLQGRRY